MLSDLHAIMQHMTDDLNTNAAKVGLRISCEKTKTNYVCWGTTYYVNLSWLKLTPECWKFPATSPTSLILKMTYERD